MIVSILGVLGLAASTIAQSPAVVCIAGQCVQGFSNLTLGSKLSAPGSPTPLHLLPGQYTSTTNPQLLHDLLVSSASSLSSSAGLPSDFSLPLNLVLKPGLAIYSDARYSGQDAFTGLPTTPVGNVTLPVAAKSLALSENVWVAVAGSSNNNERVVIWESLPDVSQVSLSSALNLLDIQSSSCSPACSGAGVCSSSGQCVCPSNFAGSSCETCAPGFFGPQCQPCPAGCETCDEGISGSGRCLSASVGDNDPRKCNCANGVCNPDGSCACNDGFVDSSDGTKCSTCAAGFFRTSTGDCAVCQLGCLQCAETTGVCNACRSGYTLNQNDRTKCDPVKPVLNTGAPCPDNTFSAGAECRVCSSLCASCSGPGDGDCLTCATNLFMNNLGRCVQADRNGVCSGTEMVADNVKRTCETCPSKCTSCGIANFGPASTIDQLQCTQCLPGFVLANGRCVETCPAGTFVNPQDNLTCIPCSSSCATCAGSADFCLSCPGNLLASSGSCVATCPSNTFSSTTETTPPTSACLSCHPDCAMCSGPGFNQCTSCSALRPVLSTLTGAESGRCLPTCAKNQYFDGTTRTCQACDSNCSSCSGPGPGRCLACASSRQIVRDGQCVDAACVGNTGVVPGLGVCLSELVQIPTATNGEPPLPTITGLEDPTKTGGAKLEWWQILLMVLGCVFIFVAFLWCCRRRARKQRAKKTALFAKGKGIDKSGWRWGMFAAGWKALFNRKTNGGAKANGKGADGELPIAYNHHEVTSRGRPVSFVVGKPSEDIKMANIGRKASTRTSESQDRSANVKANNERRKTRDDDLDSYIDAYDYSRRSLSIRSNTPSTLPDLDGYYPSGKKSRNNLDKYYDRDRLRREVTQSNRMRRERDLDQNSLFSEMTGSQRNTPEPRIPVKRDAVPIGFERGTHRSGPSISSQDSSRASSPVGKLRKAHKPAVSSADAPKEAALIDFDFGVDNTEKQLPQPPLQYKAAPFLSSIPVQTPVSTGLTPAQTYAMTMAPDLIGAGSTFPAATLFPNATSASNSTSTPQQLRTAAPLASSGTGMTLGLGFAAPGANSASINPLYSGTPATVTGGAIGTTAGLYWLEPTGTGGAGGTNFVLKPAMTGSSGITAASGTGSTGSKNPFRV